jgi:tripartite-type tricarboxylate transporter receptor subunit TctC
MSNTTTNRRCRFAAAAVLAMSFAGQGWAQADFPARPMRMLVPFPPGGAADTIGRTIADRLTAQMNQSVIVDNRPGAGGVLSGELLAKAPADGYTMMVGVPGAMVIAPLLNKRIPYSPQRDFLPLTRVSEVLNVMVVNPKAGVKTVPDFIAWAKTRGDNVRFGSSGAGQPDHIAGEFFKRLARIEMTHIPYKGGGPALIDLISGEIQVMFSTYVVARSHAEAGRLSILALTTPERQPLLPGLPTIGEALPGFGVSNWNGIFLPAGVPKAVADRLFVEVNKALLDPGLRKRQNESGIAPVGSASQDDFARFFKAEHETWSRLIQETGIQID